MDVTEDEFRTAVKAYVEAADGNRSKIAGEFECSRATIDGWWIGHWTPPPSYQAKVVAWIREQS